MVGDAEVGEAVVGDDEVGDAVDASFSHMRNAMYGSTALDTDDVGADASGKLVGELNDHTCGPDSKPMFW